MDYRQLYNKLKSKLQDCDDVEIEYSMKQIEKLIDERQSFEKEIRRKHHNYLTILETVREISLKALDIPRFEQYIINMLRGHFGVKTVIFLRQEEYLDPYFGVYTPRLIKSPKLKIPIKSNFIKHLSNLAESGNILFVNNPTPEFNDKRILNNFKNFGVNLVVPLMKKDDHNEMTMHGLICMGNRIGDVEYTDEDVEMLLLLGSMIGISLHNAHLYHRSIVDGLTRVFSRGHFDINLELELERIRKHNELTPANKPKDLQHLTLIMVDIDNFKLFNDNYGHPLGDKILYEVAQTLKNTVRKLDIVCRYGGEEFGIIIPNSGFEGAEIVAERIRNEIEELKIESADFGKVNVTISVGVAVYPDDACEIRTLIANADTALYSAKSMGKNNYVFYKSLGTDK
ncbi:MAG: sensor domain-containing diguanylate cyclase [Planctomycetes bacterium]|nr:sensor domain-containing diguanylate cyclase [Planctomycetota bacterium]